MLQAYSTQKVVHHPHLVSAIKERITHELNPIQIHLMPCNRCNSNCKWCSYRLKNWRNSQEFDRNAELPWPVMDQLVADLDSIGVRAIELTGGGEPLLYTHIVELLDSLADTHMDTALVTNGMLLTDFIADRLFDTRLKWARVSIDAGDPLQHCKHRGLKGDTWALAWDGVRRLVSRAFQNGAVIGVGFVVCEDNYGGGGDCIRAARDFGVSNVRVSVAFTPRGKDLLSQPEIAHVEKELAKAKLECEGPDFHVFDMLTERMDNMDKTEQDLPYCTVKDLLCVIEGAGNVYTCCTLAGNEAGYCGNVTEQRFPILWKGNAEARKAFDPTVKCKGPCLYESRNRFMLELMQEPSCVNFI